MGSGDFSRPIRVDTGMGIIWFIGWMFTIAFAELIWWQALLGLIICPYYLGIAVRYQIPDIFKSDKSPLRTVSEEYFLIKARQDTVLLN